MDKKKKETEGKKPELISYGEKFKEIDGSIHRLRDSVSELKQLLKSLQQVSDSLSDDGIIHDKKIAQLESAQQMCKENLETYEENLNAVTKHLKDVQDEQQRLKDDQVSLQAESKKDSNEFKVQVGSLTTSICATKKEIKEEQRLFKENQVELQQKFVSLGKTFIAQQEKQEEVSKMQNQLLESLLANHKEAHEEAKQRDEEIKNIKAQLKETKPKSTHDIKEFELQVASLTATVNSIQSETKNLMAVNQVRQEAADDLDPQAQRAHSFPPIQVICNELQQREKKQQNLVVFGLPEANSDAEDIQQLISDIGALSTVDSSFRVGKGTEGRPRPLIIRFLSKHERNEVYGKLKNLKGQKKWNKISVSPDLTKMQCMEDKNLFIILSDKAKERNEASNAREGVWKVIGRRGNKRLVLTK